MQLLAGHVFRERTPHLSAAPASQLAFSAGLKIEIENAELSTKCTQDTEGHAGWQGKQNTK